MLLTGAIVFFVCFDHFGAYAEDQGPDANADQPDELARSFGYNSRAHEITTADGYILTAFRIRNSSTFGKKSVPFILQHGMSSNCGQFVANGPRSFGFLLADNGYDVWLTNTRGAVHSRKHTSLSPDSAEFWDYSWHEKGIYDMPAIIDYILNTTGYEQLFYSGHSQGGTMFYVMNSMKPEYNRKIRYAFLLAPAGYMSHNSLARILPKPLAPAVLRGLEFSGRTVQKNRYDTEAVKSLLHKSGLCNGALPCGDATSLIMFGKNRQAAAQATGGDWKLDFSFYPDFVSIRESVHYGQLMLLPFTFRMYDFHEMNKEKYQTDEPPRYPLNRITVPITFMYATKDELVATEDVEKMGHDVANGQLYLIPHPNFHHFDFTAHPEAVNLVLTPMMEIAERYRK